MPFNYDFWYQPRHNVMVSSELGAPNTYLPGFSLDDVAAGLYGRRIHFWDWQERRIVQSVDLGDEGLIPLEVRFQHNPDSTHGYVGAALSSTLWHWSRQDGAWGVEKVLGIPPDGVGRSAFFGPDPSYRAAEKVLAADTGVIVGVADTTNLATPYPSSVVRAKELLRMRQTRLYDPLQAVDGEYGLRPDAGQGR